MISQGIFGAYIVIGIISSFSPCLFPLLPSYVALTINSKYSKKVIFLSSLALLSGIMIVFFTIGLLFTYALSFLGSYLLRNYTVFKTIQATLLILAGVILIRKPSFMDKIQLPEKIERMIYDENQATKPFTLSFLIGLAYTIIAIPCAGGYFIAVWTSLIGESLWNQFLLVLAFTIGAGLPFMIMSLYVPRFRSSFIQTVHNAQSKISIGLGIMMILVGIWLLTTDSSTFGISNI